MNEEQPTTPAGRRFIERHGTGKQREIIEIEREAAEQAVAPWRALAQRVVDEYDEDNGRAPSFVTLDLLRRLLEGAEAREPGGAPEPFLRRLNEHLDRVLALQPPFEAYQWRSFVDGLRNPALWADARGAAPREEGRTPPIDVEKDAMRVGLIRLHRLHYEFGHRPGDHFDECEFCALIQGKGFAYPVALRETPEGAQSASDEAGS